MSIFNSILEKLGIHKADVPAAPAVKAAPVAPVAPAKPGQMTPNAPVRPTFPPGSRPTAFTPIPPKPVEMPMVDVVSKLDHLAKANPQQLDWKVSIVDLFKLLGIDSSGATIQELAVELGCPESEMGDSARRNVWLHKTILKKIAENGGNIPQYLLH
jgi:hypothetical protein